MSYYNIPIGPHEASWFNLEAVESKNILVHMYTSYVAI